MTALRDVAVRARPRRARSPSRGRRAHRTGGSRPDSRCARDRLGFARPNGGAVVRLPQAEPRAAAPGSAGGPRRDRSHRARCRGSGSRPRSSAAASLSGVWPPNWTMTPSTRAAALLDAHDLDHILGGQRLEIEPVGGVVIGRDGLRVAVDHDRLDAGLAQAVGGMDAAIVELDALADAVRAAAEDDHLARGRSDRPRIPAASTPSPS